MDIPAPAEPERRFSNRLDPAAASTPDDIDGFIAWGQDHGNLDTVPSTGLQQMYLSGNRIGFRAVGQILLVRSHSATDVEAECMIQCVVTKWCSA